MDIETRYNQTLDYIYSFVDYSLKKADQLAAANFDLARMRAFMEALGNPQNAYPTIHVAGTKGKGSVSALCASALTASGRKTGLYTSPHLLDFAERIQIDGQPIPHEALAALTEEIKPVVASIPLLTTFEITTALGFLYFARQKVDAAVIEVGLGGRLDATNVITPKVAVITSLSYDHMAVLGDTLAKIAGEKAGIIKPNVPVVSAPQKQEALEVLEKISAERNAPLTVIDRDVAFSPIKHALDGQEFSIQPLGVLGTAHSSFRIPLLGDHQVVNAVTAYAALQKSGVNLSDAEIAKGFANVVWPGRFEIVNHNPAFVIDAAHNRESAQNLCQTLVEYFPGRSIIWIFAILEDKDCIGMLEELAPLTKTLIITQANHPRALESEKIFMAAQKFKIPVKVEKSAAEALEHALKLVGEKDLILSAGSVAFAGEMRATWDNRLHKLDSQG